MKFIKQLTALGLVLSLSNIASATVTSYSEVTIHFKYESEDTPNAVAEGYAVLRGPLNPADPYVYWTSTDNTDKSITLSNTKHNAGTYDNFTMALPRDFAFNSSTLYIEEGETIEAGKKYRVTPEGWKSSYWGAFSITDIADDNGVFSYDGMKHKHTYSPENPYIYSFLTNNGKGFCKASSMWCSSLYNSALESNDQEIINSQFNPELYDFMVLTELSITAPVTVEEVPVPAAFWLFGSALLGLSKLRKKAA